MLNKDSNNNYKNINTMVLAPNQKYIPINQNITSVPDYKAISYVFGSILLIVFLICATTLYVNKTRIELQNKKIELEKLKLSKK